MHSILSQLPEAVRQRIQSDPGYAETFYATNPDLRPRQAQHAPSAPEIRIIVNKLFLRVLLPIRLESEANARDWRKRSRRSQDQHKTVEDFLWPMAGVLRAALPLQISIARIAPRKLDNDNLQVTPKYVRDAIAKVLGVDDKEDPRVCWELPITQRKGAASEYATELTIQSVS